MDIFPAIDGFFIASCDFSSTELKMVLVLKDVANAIKSAGEPINIKPDLDLMVEEFAKRGVTVE